MNLLATAPETEDPARALVDIQRAGAAPAVRVRTTSGGWLSVHSTRDPLAEAHQQLAHLEVGCPGVLVILGAGLGFVTEAARARWPHATLVVVEPLAVLAEAARARTPALYASGNIRMVAGPAFDGAERLWSTFDRHVEASETPPMFVHPVLSRALPGPMADAARVVSRAVAAARMNAEARAQNAGRYLVNTLRNLGHVVSGADPARLQGQFTDAPAVVVGAGPSLDHQVEVLRGLDSRALIIAADTAWRPLVRAGVHPHLVVATDPTPENGRHLVGIARSRATWIIAEGSVDPDALHQLAGRVGVFRVADHHPWPWLRHMGVDAPTLRAWGSVLTTAFDLAVVCGCRPIVFAGADLAFTDQRPYCRGTSLEESWARHAARGVSLRQVWRRTLETRTLVEVPGVAGAPVTTAPHLVEFRDWIVARARELEAGRVVNATGAGILVGASLGQADLSEVVATFAARDHGFSDAVHQRLARKPDCARRQELRDALSAIDVNHAADTPPVGDWHRFGRPNLTVDAIAAAARAGVEALDALAAPLAAHWPGKHAESEVQPIVAGRHPVSRWHAADRVAAMRARLTGDTSGLDGCAHPPPGVEMPNASAQMGRLIDDLLAMPHVACGVGEDVAAGAAAHTVPLSMRFVWTDDAAPLVARLEELMLDAGVEDRGSPQPAPPDDGYWSAPVTPVVIDGADLAPSLDDADADGAARRMLIAERLARISVEPGTGSVTRLRRLTDATRRGLADPGLASGTTSSLHVVYPGEACALSLPLLPDALMRAATGALATATGPGDPRRALLVSRVVPVEPAILTDRGLPRGWTIATADRDHAVFTPARHTQSLRITPAGSIEPATTWPEAITGEVPWGADGGALAWNSADARVLWRERAGAGCHVESQPFRPMHAACADGAAVFADATDGLWRWSPGHAADRLATMPGSGIPRMEGDHLLVAPMLRDHHGHVARRRLPYEWRVDPATGACVETTVGTEGQCAKVAHQGRWTARSHPFADLVRLDRDDGHSVLLACYAPLGVAWAGSSLVVTTCDGAVVFFGEILGRIDAFMGSPTTVPTGGDLPLSRHLSAETQRTRVHLVPDPVGVRGRLRPTPVRVLQAAWRLRRVPRRLRGRA